MTAPQTAQSVARASGYEYRGFIITHGVREVARIRAAGPLWYTEPSDGSPATRQRVNLHQAVADSIAQDVASPSRPGRAIRVARAGAFYALAFAAGSVVAGFAGGSTVLDLARWLL